MRPLLLGGPFFLCVGIITASTKLSGEIFADRHSPYAVSKFELRRPSKCKKMAGNINFLRQEEFMKIKKDNKNSRSLNLIHVSRVI